MKHEITLDLSGERSIQQLHVKQGDIDSVEIVCTFIENNMPHVIPSGTTAYYTARKPDGTQIVNDAETSISANTVTIKPSMQVLTVAGNVQMDVVLVKDKVVKSASTFTLVANRLAADDKVVTSSDEYQAFTKALADIDGAGDYAQEQGDYAKTQGTFAKEQGTYAKGVGDTVQAKADNGDFNGTNGTNGTDGKAGINGADGADGINGTNGDDGDKGADGINGNNGTDGTNGKDGIDGNNGQDGINGKDGVVADIANGKFVFQINEAGELVLVYSTGETPPPFEISAVGELIYKF